MQLEISLKAVLSFVRGVVVFKFFFLILLQCGQ